MLPHVRRRIGSALDRRFRGVNERVESVERRVDALSAAIERLEQPLATIGSELYALREVNAAALRWLVQDHAESRRLLRELRAQPSYAAVFEDPRPLVSVVIPTYRNTELLLSRSLPSVLGQTYERLEIVVVGDAASAEVGPAVDALGDARVRFVNLPYRVPDPDPYRQWLTGSVAPRNAGHELARGTWVVDFDDDDELRPRALERGLEHAREQRLEVSYGPFAVHWPDSRPVEVMAAFPPEYGRFATQGALVHSGLHFFERTPAAVAFATPNDWFRVEAMLRAGVRFGMHDEVVFDYHPSMRGAPGT